jgi:hypothetical protein
MDYKQRLIETIERRDREIEKLLSKIKQLEKEGESAGNTLLKQRSLIQEQEDLIRIIKGENNRLLNMISSIAGNDCN